MRQSLVAALAAITLILPADRVRAEGDLVTLGTAFTGKPFVLQGDRVMDAIGFGMAGALEELRSGNGMVTLAYVLEENTWRGVTDLQLRLKDVQPEDY